MNLLFVTLPIILLRLVRRFCAKISKILVFSRLQNDEENNKKNNNKRGMGALDKFL